MILNQRSFRGSWVIAGIIAIIVFWLLGATGAEAAGPVHIVQAGENLSQIAQRYSTSVASLVTLNSLRNANIVRIGQKITVPVKPLEGLPVDAPPVFLTPAGLPLVEVAPPQAPVIALPKSAPAADARYSGKWIDVDLATQTLTAYEGNTPVRSVLVSTGKAGTPTLLGQFHVYAKYPAQAMSGPGYYLPGVPNVMYFIGGYAIHGAYWHVNWGIPISHGCVNMPLDEAAWLYKWTPMGTLVNVRKGGSAPVPPPAQSPLPANGTWQSLLNRYVPE